MEHFFTVNIYLNLKIILRGSHCYEPHFTGEEIVAESGEKVSQAHIVRQPVSESRPS